MLRVQQLKRPNKRSGNPLEDGKTTTIKGLVITNKSGKTVYVDKFTPRWRKK